MNTLELFNECLSRKGYITAGIDVQYKFVKRVLFFQCSASESDWKYNFKASGDVYSNSDIEFIGHKGFNELWQSIRHLIETLDFDMIVGYSQGAVIALRAHENYFHRKGFEPITWLFGEPPSIKKPSAKLLKRFAKVVSIYNYNDIVFHAPKLLGYKHVGRQIKLNSRSIKRPSSYPFLHWISGHTPVQYRQALELRV